MGKLYFTDIKEIEVEHYNVSSLELKKYGFNIFQRISFLS